MAIPWLSPNPPLTYNFAKVPAVEYDPGWYKYLTEGGFLVRYFIETTYSLSTGIVCMPLAAPDGAGQVVVKTAAASSHKIIRWLVQRVGGQPVLPHWDTGNGNEVLLAKSIRPENPQASADLKNIWQVTGEYVYALRHPQNDESGLTCGWIPYGNPGQFVYQGQRFDKAILKNKVVPIAIGPTPEIAKQNQDDINLEWNNPIRSPY